MAFVGDDGTNGEVYWLKFFSLLALIYIGAERGDIAINRDYRKANIFKPTTIPLRSTRALQALSPSTDCPAKPAPAPAQHPSTTHLAFRPSRLPLALMPTKTSLRELKT